MNKSLYAFHALLAAIIDCAIDDIKGIGPPCRMVETDRAMAFILSETCEAYCLELEINYEAIREKAAELYRRVLVDEPQTTAKYRCHVPIRQSHKERKDSPLQGNQGHFSGAMFNQ